MVDETNDMLNGYQKVYENGERHNITNLQYIVKHSICMVYGAERCGAVFLLRLECLQ